MAVMALYTYGNVEVLTNLFNGIAGAVGTDAYVSLLKITTLLGLSYVLLESVFRQSFMVNIRWFISFLLIYQILLVPKVTLNIEDPISEENAVVANVPLGLGVFASITSLIGYSLTEMTETVFTLPDDLRYNRTGSLMASRLVEETLSSHVQNPVISKNLQQFVEQCVFYDLLLGRYTLDELTDNPALWHFIQDHTSQARAFRYGDAILSCTEGAAALIHDLERAVTAQQTRLGRLLFPKASDPTGELESFLPIGAGYLLNLSSQQYDIIEQSLLANAVRDGLLKQGTRLDSAATVQGFAALRANQIKESAYTTTGLLASRWLSIMKNVFEALFYGAFLFLSLLFLLPWGTQLLKSYLFSLFWLQTWAPLYAILNLVMTVNARNQTTNLLLNNGGVTLSNLTAITQTQVDTMALAGFLSMSIPFIAFGIVKGGASAFTNLATHIGNISQSAATRAAEEVTSGNFSFGNAQLANQSMQNTHGFQYQTNPTFQSGMVSTQLPSGAIAARSSDGTNIISSHSAISSGAAQLNLSDSLRGVAQAQSDKAWSHGVTHAEHYADNLQTEFRQMKDVQANEGLQHSLDSTSGHSDSHQFSHHVQEMGQLQQQFGEQYGYNEQQTSRLLAAAQTMLKMGSGGPQSFVDLSASLMGSMEGMTSTERQQGLSDATHFIESSQYQYHQEEAERAWNDMSERLTDDNGIRLNDNLSDTMSRGEQYRQEAMQSFQQSEQYHQTASLSKESSVMKNANLTQGFVDWLGTQSSPAHPNQTMTPQDIEHLINHPSTTLDGYTHQYLEGVSTHLTDQSSDAMKALIPPQESMQLDEKKALMNAAHEDNQSAMDATHAVARMQPDWDSAQSMPPVERIEDNNMEASIKTQTNDMKQTVASKMDPNQTSLLNENWRQAGKTIKSFVTDIKNERFSDKT